MPTVRLLHVCTAYVCIWLFVCIFASGLCRERRYCILYLSEPDITLAHSCLMALMKKLWLIIRVSMFMFWSASCCNICWGDYLLLLLGACCCSG